jgi:subtilisin family serine protease
MAGDYIIKLKETAHTFSSLKSYGEVRNIDTSFGKFLVLTSNNKSIMDIVSQNPNVEYIEPNYKYHAFKTPSDTDFTKQWGLNNDGKNSGSWWSRGTAGVDINAIKAWAVTKGTKDIKIAVIDTGVDYKHSDLAKNIMVNEAELNGTAGVDDDGNGYIDDTYGYDFANGDADPMDGHGHGTHCAGVIGASHDAKGIAGVMANVQLLPIKFLTDKGSGDLEGAIKSIDYAISRGVNVMSNSWGGGGRSQALFDAVERAQEAGIIFIAAAGNENNDNDAKPSYPASYKLDNVVSVGAMDGKGKRASFSNYGANSVHVFAPGVNIYSTVSNNKYKKMSGTSMACPHVAGVAGLLLASEPNLSYTDIKNRLMNTSVSSSELGPYTASGYVDAYDALLNKR